MGTIKGGYYIKARRIKYSEIANCAPSVREIFDYLMREANHEDKRSSGRTIKRGQLFRTYEEIKEALHWKVGWRKAVYSDNQVKKAMKILRSTLMVSTKKELGGVLITVCKYDFYQNPKNYEGTIEQPMKEPTPIPHKQELKERRKKNKNIAPKKGATWKEVTPMDLKQFVEWCRKSKDAHVQIIGEWADELNQSFEFTGYETYGEWYRLFFKQNLKAAQDLSPSWKQENGRTRMSEATALLVSESKNGHWKTGNLSTLIKYMSKV